MTNPIEIQQKISERAPEFKHFIDKVLHDSGMDSFIRYFAEKTNVYVFSGVIRDFLLGEHNADSVHDYDFVISGFNHISIPAEVYAQLVYKRNKFGGLKINKDSYLFDVWDLEETWGIVNQRVKKPNAEALAKSAFFNFSAIVFDYNKSNFIISKEFCDFYISKKMDVVYKSNPYVESCIVNSFYYAHQYGFGIGDSLKKWILECYSKNADYETVQVNHFGHVIYENEQIESLVMSLIQG
jgi:hypothetical protein